MSPMVLQLQIITLRDSTGSLRKLCSEHGARFLRRAADTQHLLQCVDQTIAVISRCAAKTEVPIVQADNLTAVDRPLRQDLPPHLPHVRNVITQLSVCMSRVPGCTAREREVRAVIFCVPWLATSAAWPRFSLFICLCLLALPVVLRSAAATRCAALKASCCIWGCCLLVVHRTLSSLLVYSYTRARV